MAIIHFALYLDELSYTLPDDADRAAVAKQIGTAMRDGTPVKVDIAQPNGDVIATLVNPSRARIVYIAPRDIGVGTPGHSA